jgi:hypothetical protein
MVEATVQVWMIENRNEQRVSSQSSLPAPEPNRHKLAS